MDVFVKRPIVAIVLSLIIVITGIRAAMDISGICSFPKSAVHHCKSQHLT